MVSGVRMQKARRRPRRSLVGRNAVINGPCERVLFVQKRFGEDGNDGAVFFKGYFAHALRRSAYTFGSGNGNGSAEVIGSLIIFGKNKLTGAIGVDFLRPAKHGIPLVVASEIRGSC